MKGFSNIGPLIWQRMRSQWWLTLTLGAGVLIAATLMAVSPVYLRVMNDLGLQHLFEERSPNSAHNGYVVPTERFGDPDAPRRHAELSRLLSREIGWFTESEVRFGAMPLTLASSDDVWAGLLAQNLGTLTVITLNSLCRFPGTGVQIIIDGKTPKRVCCRHCYCLRCWIRK